MVQLDNRLDWKCSVMPATRKGEGGEESAEEAEIMVPIIGELRGTPFKNSPLSGYIAFFHKAPGQKNSFI